MFISSHYKQSIKSKKSKLCSDLVMHVHFITILTKHQIKTFFNKSFQLNEGYKIINKLFAVIWSKMLIASQSKQSIKSKKWLREFIQQHKEGYGIQNQNYEVIWS